MAEPEAVVEPGNVQKRRGGILPLVAVLVVTIGGGAVAGSQGLGPRIGAALAERAAAETEQAEPEAVAIHVVDNLVVNPAGSGGSRFLLTTVALQAAAPEDVARLAAKDVEIRHAFTLVLGTRTVEALTDVALREGLTRELLLATHAIMGPGVVVRVLIPQFVVQ